MPACHYDALVFGSCVCAQLYFLDLALIQTEILEMRLVCQKAPARFMPYVHGS